MEQTITGGNQCLWCGEQNVDILHQQFILPLCPKCLTEFTSDD